MLTAEIKVNGVLIGHIYAVNRGYVEKTGNSVYDWEVYIPPTSIMDPNPPVRGGTELKHKQEDGALALISKIIKAWEKGRKKS